MVEVIPESQFTVPSCILAEAVLHTAVGSQGSRRFNTDIKGLVPLGKVIMPRNMQPQLAMIRVTLVQQSPLQGNTRHGSSSTKHGTHAPPLMDHPVHAPTLPAFDSLAMQVEGRQGRGACGQGMDPKLHPNHRVAKPDVGCTQMTR